MVTSLSADEKRALLARRLKQSADQKLFHRGFEEQAAQSPNAIAVAHDGQAVTYQALNARANRLARRLRALGAGPEMLVGLCVERSVEMAVGLLGILKSGAAYVPLDPAFPRDRLAMMLADAGVAVLITQDRLRESLPEHEAFVVSIETIEDDVDGAVESNLPDGAAADNLAYVIYTSGSTGKPKGVAITHGSLSNFLASMRALFPMGASDTLLAVTTLSFDIAALELFLPLVQGARVEIAGRELAIDGKSLALRLEHSDVTFCQATPSTWRMLEAAGWAGAPGLTILCGGESLPRDLADRLIGKGKALWNLYGPTETTIWSSAGQVSPGEAPITIGKPIVQTQLHALDGSMQLVPPGVAGELYIGGAGVAHGYLNRPDLTAERFVPDPFSMVPGARLYRTGDRVRLRSDGTYECLGRLDHQVKIRGFRIELGEVETLLRRHPLVRDAVVVAREDSSGSLELVAYVVSEDGQRLVGADLRRHLLESLPEYMVPASFTTLASFPMTPNGKVDRQGLPEPAVNDPAAAQAYLPPRGPIEEGIAQLWSALLGRPRVGIEDNLFEIGGHSLLATQILARVRDLYGVETPLRDFLERPTVAWLSQRVEQQMREGAGLQTPPIVPVPRSGSAPASFAQQRLWFLDQLDPDSPVYNMPVEVSLVGELDVAALRRVFNEIVRRHEVLRTTFAAVDGRPRQVIAPHLEIDLPLIDLSELDEQSRRSEAQRLITLEARRAFNMAKGPLIRAVLLRLGSQEHLVLVTMHHIVADAWSFGVLIREASLLYGAFSGGLPSPLPELALQYADYAAWQEQWQGESVLTKQLDYWTALLRGLPVLDLPTDHPRPPALSGRGSRRELGLSSKLLGEIQALSRRENATMFMTLMAAFQALIGRYSGQRDFAVGTPIAGRTRSEIENLVGLFVNTLVLRADLSGNLDFITLLRRVRENALGAYTHQDLPFEQIVAVLQPQRDPARSPLFQVLFAMNNAPLPAFESPELSMTPAEPDTGTSKFDLAFFAIEKPQCLELQIQYSTDLFDAATIDQMLRHFRTLLEGATARPDQPISSLPLLSEAERQDLLGDEALACTDLDGLTDEEVDALLARLESETDVADRAK